MKAFMGGLHRCAAALQIDLGDRLRLAVAALMVALAVVAFTNRAVAQSAEKMFEDASAKTNKSVEIEADSMEVQQDEKRAIFVGNVDAVRGNIHLKSDKLVVDYKEVKNGETKKTEVTLLTATGNVVVTSKGQISHSEWAKMDVTANTVVMGGNVVLREGQSVVRGKRLEIDLNTGKSKVVGGRVKGLFFPAESKN